jgi:hypothetical protein
MSNAVSSYFGTVATTFGRGWNHFWFTLSRPTTLGLMRLVVGLIALHWYWSYYPDLDLLFGPAGIIDEQALNSWRGPDSWNNKPTFTLFDWIGDISTLGFMYWLGFGVIALFAAGVLSRVTTVLAFIFVASLIHRGPMLVRPFEDLLAMTMFYLCFGAIGGAFSIDALIKRRRQGDRAVDDNVSWGTTVSTRLIQVHLVLVHFGMAVSQLAAQSSNTVPTWWLGRALWGFAGKPESSYLDLTWLADHLYLLNLWTYAVVIYEIAFALFIWRPLARPFLLAVSIPVWGSIGLASGDLPFAAIMLAATLAFVPPEWLDRHGLTAKTDPTNRSSIAST